MKQKKSKQYIEILSDFGWKYYFGREENKINLINLLNSLLEGEHVIDDLYYINVEEDGDLVGDRKVVFDLRCVGLSGEQFLVEMQLQNQDFFFDRAITYTSRTISRLAKKGGKVMVMNCHLFILWLCLVFNWTNRMVTNTITVPRSWTNLITKYYMTS